MPFQPRAFVLTLAFAILTAFAIPAARGADRDDGAFLLTIGLMEGHLGIGEALLEAGHPDLALPHFGHPVRELYGDLAPELAARGLPSLDGQLIALETKVASDPAAPETRAAYRAVMARLASARMSLPESTRASVPAMLPVCAGLMDVAAGEYATALAGARVVNLTEYHDAKGFVAIAGLYLGDLVAGGESEGRRLAAVADAQHHAAHITEALLPSGDAEDSAVMRAVADRALESATVK